jgi:DNA-binding GntR family transcriptional regulator
MTVDPTVMAGYASLTDIVVSAITERVITGEFQPEEKLSEARVAEIVGVSRSPVREAFHRLAREGMLIIQPRKGTIVAPITAGEAVDFYDCRILFEVECTRLAAPHSSAALGLLQNRLGDMQQAMRERQLLEYLEHVAAFHETVQDCCPNRELVAIIQSMWRRAMRFRSVAIRYEDRLDRSFAQHAALLEALTALSGDRAAAIVRGILEESKRAILLELAARGSAEAKGYLERAYER